MRKLTWMAALLGAFAWASAGYAQSTTQEGSDRSAREWTDDQKQKAGKKMEETGERMQHGSDQTGSASGQERAGTPGSPGYAASGNPSEKKHPLFEGKSNFDVEGKVQRASTTSITVTRDELPPATLTIDRNTKIEVDGQQSSARMLRPGQDVKASFNLQGSKVMAVEVKAEKKEQ